MLTALGDLDRELRAWFSDPEMLQFLAIAPYQISLAAEEEFIRSKATNDWDHGIALAIDTVDVTRYALGERRPYVASG